MIETLGGATVLLLAGVPVFIVCYGLIALGRIWWNTSRIRESARVQAKWLAVIADELREANGKQPLGTARPGLYVGGGWRRRGRRAS